MSTSSLQESIGSDVDKRPIKVKILIGGKPVDSSPQSQSVPSGKERPPSETEDAEEVALISSGSDIVPKNCSISDASRAITSTYEEDVDKEVVHKGWNLRPRKKRQWEADGELPQADEENGESKDSEKKLEWSKFSLSLTPEEIEEDIFAMTGSRPSRKPTRRRPKAVQKKLDNLFPGMRLGSITPKDYEVPEGSKKK